MPNQKQTTKIKIPILRIKELPNERVGFCH